MRHSLEAVVSGRPRMQSEQILCTRLLHFTVTLQLSVICQYHSYDLSELACLSLCLNTVCAGTGVQITVKPVKVIWFKFTSAHASRLISRTGKKFDGVLCNLWPLVTFECRASVKIKDVACFW